MWAIYLLTLLRINCDENSRFLEKVAAVTIMNDKYIGSGQLGGYGFVEMASKSRGEAAITSLKGKKLRELVIDVVEALPLSDKRGIGSLQSRGSWFNRKGRQRRYQTS